MKNQLSENIRSLRKKEGLTQEQLAEVLDVTLSAVSKWETASTTPDLDTLVMIAEYFEISIDSLLGYECLHDSMQQYIGQMKALCSEGDFQKCAEVTEVAVRHYPNSFEVIHLGAEAYYLMGAKSHNKAWLNRSVQLYNRALRLVGQNSDSVWNEWTIRNDIAAVYLCMGDVASALSELKTNNVAGFNDQIIGYTLVCNSKRPEEAMPYLSRALVSSLMQLDRIFVALANAYVQLGQYPTAVDALLALEDIYKNFRIPGKVSYLDKLSARSMVGCSQIAESVGMLDVAEQTLAKAKEYAAIFDAQPENNFKNVRFCECGDNQIMPFDDFGTTAMDGIEKTLREKRPESEASRLVFGKL